VNFTLPLLCVANSLMIKLVLESFCTDLVQDLVFIRPVLFGRVQEKMLSC
jgi:hypothetical protein